MRGIRIGFVVAIFTVLHAQGVSAQPSRARTAPSPLWGWLEPGPHDVGFRVTYAFDHTRSFLLPADSARRAYAGRPIRIMTWFPAVRPGRPLAFADYIEVDSPEPFTGWNETRKIADRRTAARQFLHPDSARLTRALLAVRVGATSGAPPSPGRYPLLLHSLGRNDYQQESTILWEYLASHGYVVAVIPQLGASPESPGLRMTAADMDVQLRDLQFALAQLVFGPQVDRERIAVVGHSSGGLVGLMLAAQNRNVDAVVSLDGSIHRAVQDTVLGATPWWRPSEVGASLLHLYNADAAPITWAPVDSLVASDRYLVGFRRATHFDFQNWPALLAWAGIEDIRTSRPTARGRDVFLGAAALTRHFLDAVLGGRHESLRHVRGDVPTAGIDPAQTEFRVLPSTRRP